MVFNIIKNKGKTWSYNLPHKYRGDYCSTEKTITFKTFNKNWQNSYCRPRQCLQTTKNNVIVNIFQMFYTCILYVFFIGFIFIFSVFLSVDAFFPFLFFFSQTHVFHSCLSRFSSFILMHFSNFQQGSEKTSNKLKTNIQLFSQNWSDIFP